jgi:phage terminase small subunit
MHKLSGKQILFARAYAECGNASRALREAGYAEASVRADLAARLLNTASVVKEVRRLQKRKIQTNILSKERVVQEIAHLAYSNIDDYEFVNGKLCAKPDAPEGAMRAVASWRQKIRPDGGTEIEIKLWSKPEALKLAGQTLNIYADRHEISGPNGAPIQVQVEERILTTIELADLRARLG